MAAQSGLLVRCGSGGCGCVFLQRNIRMKSKKRGCHLVTREILSAVPEIKLFIVGIMHLFRTCGLLCSLLEGSTRSGLLIN